MTYQEKDLLRIHIFETRSEMGASAARDIERAVCEVIEKKGTCNVIFAAAPSQNEVLQGLAESKKIDWSRVTAYHMDEYVGIASDAPQGFARFLELALFSRVPLGKVEYLNCEADAEKETVRYANILRENPADIVVMGIGENGHIAFNDPHVALFDDPELVKIVTLDEKCRQQQVNDGCFATLEDVPTTAMTLTIPALIAAPKVFCVVPAKTKAEAVCATVNGPVTEACPASILRRHNNAVLYLDSDSSSLLKK